MNKRKKRILIYSILLISAICAVIGFLKISMALIEPDAHIYPSYTMIDLSQLLSKRVYSDEDYRTLYFQTGLGKPAIDEILEGSSNWQQRILQFQKNFFGRINIVCEKNSPISKEESIVDENGYYIAGTEMAPIHEGYILVTKSSYTYGWRNGHCALVVDAGNGKTLESVVLGTDSSIQDVDKWTNFPNFILLRPKGESYKVMKEITDTAQEVLLNIPYDLTVGIFSPKLTDRSKVKGTHCSHLIWQAYSLYGYDLDSDGGAIVTPNDIANSPALEVVQVYGVDPENIWP